VLFVFFILGFLFCYFLLWFHLYRYLL
jgi:hypothetical protein